MGISDWIAIAVLGAGAVMGTLGKRLIRAIGITLIMVALVGAAFSHRESLLPGVICSTSIGRDLNGTLNIECGNQIPPAAIPRTLRDDQKKDILAAVRKSPQTTILFIVRGLQGE